MLLELQQAMVSLHTSSSSPVPYVPLGGLLYRSYLPPTYSQMLAGMSHKPLSASVQLTPSVSYYLCDRVLQVDQRSCQEGEGGEGGSTSFPCTGGGVPALPAQFVSLHDLSKVAPRHLHTLIDKGSHTAHLQVTWSLVLFVKKAIGGLCIDVKRPKRTN